MVSSNSERNLGTHLFAPRCCGGYFRGSDSAGVCCFFVRLDFRGGSKCDLCGVGIKQLVCFKVDSLHTDLIVASCKAIINCKLLNNSTSI